MDDVFIHEAAMVESQHIGEGTRIWAHAHVMEGAVVGRKCNLGEGVFVEGGARLGDWVTVKNGVSVWDMVTCEDYVFLGPNCVLTNDPAPRSHPDYKGNRAKWRPTLIRTGATVGANATIVCGTVLGRWSFVAAGAVVTHNVPAHALVAGVPARQTGWVCRCGLRLNEALRCECGKNYSTESGGGLKETT